MAQLVAQHGPLCGQDAHRLLRANALRVCPACPDWYAKRLADLTGLEVSHTDALKDALGRGLKQAAEDFEALDKARAEEYPEKPTKKERK